MTIQLFEHQKEQVNLGLNGKNINQSQAGSGKTFVGLEIFKESTYKKLVIVCLAPKVKDFQEDGEKVGLEITPLNKGTKKNRELLNNTQLISISFESVWRLKELLKWVDKDTMLLVDESHKAKSPSSKVGYFMDKLSSKVGYSYIMSATMTSNGHYEDYYQQLKMAKLYKGTFADFKKRYCVEELQSVKVKGRTQYFNSIVDYQNTDELMELVNSHSVYADRKKAYEVMDVFYQTKKPTMYGRILKKRMVQLEDGTIIEYDSLSKLRHALLQLASGVLKGIDKPLNTDKLDRVDQILNEHENERVVIFYNYQSEYDALKQMIGVRHKDRGMGTYNGASKDLGGFVGGTDGVILVQYKSGATGINDLVIASTTIFFSMPCSSSLYIQAKARTDRYGQDEGCIYYHLVCDKTIEQDVYNTVISGKDFTDKMLESLL